MDQWILFELVEKGYYDPRTGKKLDSIEGRRNRPDIDPFKHLGIIYPKIAQDKHKHKHIEWHEKRPKLLLKLDITDGDASRITELDAKRLTDQEVETLKRELEDLKDRTRDRREIKSASPEMMVAANQGRRHKTPRCSW